MDEISKKEMMEMRAKMRAAAREAAEKSGRDVPMPTDEEIIAAIKKERLGDLLAEHTVGPGDSLSTIAKKYYGSAYHYPFLYEANKDVIGDDPNVIIDGTVLKIPKLPEEK